MGNTMITTIQNGYIPSLLTRTSFALQNNLKGKEPEN